jgi:hypothetical protein
MTAKSKFNAQQLRVGDYALIQDGKKPRAAEVVFKAKHYLGSIRVRFADGAERSFDSRNTGFADIVGGARNISGHWTPL